MKILRSILDWLVTLLIPLALIFLGVRLLLSHAFPQIEYRLPGFPVDIYGFSLEDRLTWSRYSIDYLLNDAGVEFLGDLEFQDGTPVFNERELSHMLDVKKVVQPVLWIGTGIWVFILAVGIWARFSGGWQEFLRGLRRGGWLTLGLVLLAGIFAAVSFWQFFTLFHSLFFSGDSWIFLYSDTLIRLFPIRFWQDAVIFIGILAVGGGLALGLAAKPAGKRVQEYK